MGVYKRRLAKEEDKGWTQRDSNPRPLLCESSALPLSYGPVRHVPKIKVYVLRVSIWSVEFKNPNIATIR